MFSVYKVFIAFFAQFPVLGFRIGHSGSQPFNCCILFILLEQQSKEKLVCANILLMTKNVERAETLCYTDAYVCHG